MITINAKSRFRGCLLGLAIGDAIGGPAQFTPRGMFQPITGLRAGGPFNLPAGYWSDDTSMALCLADSLVTCKKFDAGDQARRYLAWLDYGYMSSLPYAFDVGLTVRIALSRFRADPGNPYAGPTEPNRAGNGCIMRLAPVPMFYAFDIDKAEYFAAQSCRVTHGAQEAIDATRLFARILVRALRGTTADKAEVLFADAGQDYEASIAEIARGAYLGKMEEEIVGAGYVVHCLEAALWCFATTTSFKDAVLKAANLGDDADTTAAVTGQIAGAFYGEISIPRRWLKIKDADRIVVYADDLFALSGQEERDARRLCG